MAKPSRKQLEKAAVLVFLLLFGFCCSHATDNTIVKGAVLDETERQTSTGTTSNGAVEHRTEGPTTTVKTGGWVEVVTSPATPAKASSRASLDAALKPISEMTGEPIPPQELEPGVWAVYHPAVETTTTGPVDDEVQSWAKAVTGAETNTDLKAVNTENDENKSKWNFGLKWYVWVAGILAIGLAGYVFRKSVPFLKWIP